jgi:hypothetical protein
MINITKLKPGDMVKHVNGSRYFVVTANYGDRVTATATVDITNPIELELVSKSETKK